MAERKADGVLKAPPSLNLTPDEEQKAFVLMSTMLCKRDPMPADWRELAWILAVEMVRSREPKKRGKKPTWTLEEELFIAKLVEEELQRRGQASDDRKVVINITAALKARFPYFSDFTPERLRNIYYKARPLFLAFQQLHANSQEIACSKSEHDD